MSIEVVQRLHESAALPTEVKEVLAMCGRTAGYYSDLGKGMCDTTQQSLRPCDERPCGIPVLSGQISHTRENRQF
jgi:hypothetical protein